MNTQNVDLMSHPPYSPYLTTNDSFLFPHIKNKLRGQLFLISEEAVDALKKHVLKMLQLMWKKCFEDWFKQMQKFIYLNGDHFEKQSNIF